jgi:putative DNA primase/helicase
LILVRWPVTISEDEVDRQLSTKLRAEASGILNRLLDGLRDWRDHGLIIPEEIKDATEHYRRDSDVLGRFLEECTAVDEQGQISNGELHALFCAWANANGEVPWKKKGLTRALQERGYVQLRSDERYWRDLSTTKSPSDFGQAIRSSDMNQDDTDHEDEI